MMGWTSDQSGYIEGNMGYCIRGCLAIVLS